MTGKALKNLYPRLRPDERFRLAVNAVARKDWDEFGLLSGSCPTYVYRATDLAYRERLWAASYIALHVANRLLSAESALEAPMFAREVLMADARALATEFGDGTTTEAADGEWPEIVSQTDHSELDDLCRQGIAVVLGICEGFERFCEGLGIEPAALLAFAPDCLPVWWRAVRLRGTDSPSDPARAEAFCELLEGVWKGMLDDQDPEPQDHQEAKSA
jgi:hypothetical protein